MANPDEGWRKRPSWKERDLFAGHFARTAGDLAVLWLPHGVPWMEARQRRRRVV
jgi:hypothetical protein